MPELDPQALEALVERMDTDGDEERDEDLGNFFCFAWPSLAAQNG